MRQKKNLCHRVHLFLENKVEFRKLQNECSIIWIGVYSGYKSLELIDDGSTGRN